MELVKILERDYQKFPQDQTYDIYAEDVYFEDPLNSFKGKKRYQKMITFLEKFFSGIELQLHSIVENEGTITTQWTLCMSSPLPWKPRLTIPGWSELEVNSEGLIVVHRDRWDISPMQVLKQNFVIA